MSPLFLLNSEAAETAAVVYISSFCRLWLDKRLQLLSLETAMAIQGTVSFLRNFYLVLLKRVNVMQALWREHLYIWKTTQVKVLMIAPKQKLFFFPLKRCPKYFYAFPTVWFGYFYLVLFVFFFHISELFRHLNLPSDFTNNKNCCVL